MPAEKEFEMNGVVSTPTSNATSLRINAAQRKFIQGMGPQQAKVRAELLKRLAEEPDMPVLQRWTRKLLRSSLFDYLMSAVILSNMVAMIIETDRSTTDEEPFSSTHWTAVFGWVVLVVFIIELIARLYAYRCDFWKDSWNRFDFLIVSIDTVFSFVGLMAVYLFPVSILRIFRLAKLVRISKVMRVFPELRLLIAGIVCSVSAIFWGTVLLAFALLVWAMVAVLFIHPLNKEVYYDESCPRCPRAYSSVMQASLTFWQQIVTGDSWGQATIPIIEENPFTAVFFCAVYLSLGMAVINLILGVVVSVAERAREDIEADDHKEDMIIKAEQTTRLLGLCIKMDIDNDGVISHEEICRGYEEPGEFRDALLSLEITRDEIEIVWKVIDSDQHGAVPYEDVVSALYAVKTSDTQFMLAYIKHYITVMKDALLEAMKEQYKKEESIERTVIEARQDILDSEAKQFGLLESEALKYGSWQRLNDQQRSQTFCQEHTETDPATCSNHRSAVFHGFQDAEIRDSKVSMDDESLACLKRVCHRISTTRIELEDILTDIKCKFQALASTEDGNGIASTDAKAASFTVFNNKVSDIFSQFTGHSESGTSMSKYDLEMCESSYNSPTVASM